MKLYVLSFNLRITPIIGMTLRTLKETKQLQDELGNGAFTSNLSSQQTDGV